MSYHIGSGPLVQHLPEVQQEPNCGLVFNRFSLSEISTSLSQEKLKSVVHFDFNNFSFEMDTNNYSYIGNSISFKVKIDVADGELI